MRTLLTVVTVIGFVVPVLASPPGELAAPVNVVADGKAIDVERVGYAAPFVGDFDGDGVRDLLVGEFYQGRLRIYRNLGTNTEPRFNKHTRFQDGAETGRIPAG